jgi:AcrR family transcriptional regulator
MAGIDIKESCLDKHRPCSGSSLTVERILNAAQQVLVTRGYAGFTMRLVAQTAEISPGNLTYHFQSKSELLRALIFRLMEIYARQFDDLVSASDISLGQDLEQLVHWLMMENVSEETVRISRELWAMALHDEVIRDAVDDFYDELIKRLVQLLARSRPNAELTAIHELVQFLALLSEGTAVLFGTRRKRAVSFERIVELAAPLLEALEPSRKARAKVSE